MNLNAILPDALSGSSGLSAQSLLALTLIVAAIALAAISSVALASRRGPAIRELIWTTGLTACLAASLSVLWGPRLLLSSSAANNAASAVVSAIDARFLEPRPTVTGQAFEKPTIARRDGELLVERILVLGWWAGVVFFVFRLCRQLPLAAKLRRRAVPIADDRWIRIIADAKKTAGFVGEFDVFVSADIDLPLTTGIMRPAVLFPVASVEWGPVEVRIVLLHEIAHIMRRDLFARCIAIAACGLNWYNPLVWWLNRRAHSDAELAADEAVLRMGIAGSTFAQTLLNIRDQIIRAPDVEPAMLFAHQPLLSIRIHAVLEKTSRCVSVPYAVRSTTLIGSFLVAATLGCVRLRAIHDTSVAAGDTERAVSVPLADLPSGATGRTGRNALGPNERKLSDRPATQTSRSPAASQIQPAEDWIGPAARGLIDVLSDPSPQVRGAAVKSLGDLAMPETRASIERMLTDSDAFVGYEARLALKKASST